MNFDELIQLQVLKRKASGVGSRLVDQMMESTDSPEIRQMCAKVSTVLYDRMENVTEILDLSKREFIEAAVLDAVARAEDAIERSLDPAQRSL